MCLIDNSAEKEIKEIKENITKAYIIGNNISFFKKQIKNIAIVRIEQLYPFPVKQYNETIKTYPNLKEVVWCQEEPQNQGAWYQIRHRLQHAITDQKLTYSGRPSAAAPAVGVLKIHNKQQKMIINNTLKYKVN